jgi:hypothetical protein
VECVRLISLRRRPVDHAEPVEWKPPDTNTSARHPYTLHCIACHACTISMPQISLLLGCYVKGMVSHGLCGQPGNKLNFLFLCHGFLPPNPQAVNVGMYSTEPENKIENRRAWSPMVSAVNPATNLTSFFCAMVSCPPTPNQSMLGCIPLDPKTK